MHVDERFQEVLSTLRGVAGQQLDQLVKVPDELSKFLALENPKGIIQVNLVFTVPDGFVEAFDAALKRALKKNA